MIKAPRAITLIITVLAAVYIAVTSTLPANAVNTWTSETQVTASGQTTTQPPHILSGSDGSMTALTVETVNSVYSVLARRSTDGGTTWGSPTVLSAAGIATQDLDVLKLSTGVFVAAWAEASGTANVTRIRLTTSTDNGQSWTATRTVSTADPNAWAAKAPHLAQFGLNDVAVGFSQSDGSNDIATVRTSNSSIQTWSPSHGISATGSDASHVVPVVNSNGDVVVSWVLTASNFTKQAQIAGSSSWSTVTTLSSYAVGGIDRVPAVVALPSGAFVALWSDPTASSSPSFTVMAATTTDVAQTWSTADAVSGTAFPNSITAIATPDGQVTAVWTMGTGGYTYLESSHSSPASSPSPSSSSSSSPSSSSSSSSSSSPSPTTWQSPVAVSPSVSGQYYFDPQLALSPDGTLALAFVQNVNGTYASGSTLSSDNGVSWPQGLGSVSSWQISPVSISGVSVAPLNTSGFAFSWQTLTSNNPYQGFVRVWGPATSSGSSTPTPTLPATGGTFWIIALLGAAFLGSGVIFWGITTHTRRSR